MKQTVKGNLFVLELNELDSAFISQIVYDAKNEVLSVVLKNENVYNYQKVPMEVFLEFSTANSFGSFYNSEIKSKFKHLTMANETAKKTNQPNKINKAGKHNRYIKQKIDLMKLNKDWFFIKRDDDGNVKAIYADITLFMKPDGEVDKYGQLGFIKQDVPAEVIKSARESAGPKPEGAIIGNAEELEWVKQDESEGAELVTEEDEDAMEGLPF